MKGTHMQTWTTYLRCTYVILTTTESDKWTSVLCLYSPGIEVPIDKAAQCESAPEAAGAITDCLWVCVLRERRAMTSEHTNPRKAWESDLREYSADIR